MDQSGPAVGGNQKREELLQLLRRDQRPRVDGVVVVEERLASYAAGYRPRAQPDDLPVDRLHLGAEGLVVHREGLRLHDNDLGRLVRSPELVDQEGVRALGLVPAREPELGRGGAAEESVYEPGGDRQQHRSHAYGYPPPSRTGPRQ